MNYEAMLDIAAIERDTGIKKDTLRIWERRYGFPSPQRMPSGDRIYSSTELSRLMLIKRLIDSGYRPKQLVTLDEPALHALLSSGNVAASRKKSANVMLPDISLDWMKLIKAHDMFTLRNRLREHLAREGLAQVIDGLLAPLSVKVGEAWLAGELAVFEEHLFTDSVTSVLREALAGFDAVPMSRNLVPRVLMTTLPHELHGVGLLMAECFFRLAGCHCYSLGSSTPIVEIVKAAVSLKVDVVALSISAHQSPRNILAGIRHLREQLSPEVEIWVGGNAPVIHGRKLEQGIVSLRRASDIARVVDGWRS
jgi:DNA-binding transcriptional MerR regulator/methylmalonyl-CoA mutase cobalamin-binding subunit